MVTKDIIDRLCDEFDNERGHIEALLELLMSGAAPLFICRYRKEAIGAMPWDRQQEIERRFRFLDHMERRKQHFLEEAKKKKLDLDPALAEAISSTFDAARFDDLTRPFAKRPAKRKKGKKDTGPAGPDPAKLAPFLEKVRNGDLGGASMMEMASSLVDAQAGLPDAAAVIDGAARLLGRDVAEDSDIREKTRDKLRQGVIHVRSTENKKKGAERYKDFVGLREPIPRIPPAKILTILRGAREKHLSIELLVDQVPLGDFLEKKYFPNMKRADADLQRFIQEGIRNALNRHILPECQDAVLEEIRERRSRDGLLPIKARLRSLLMAPPFPGQTVMAMDPDNRKGHRLVVTLPDGSFCDDGIIRLDTEEKKAEATTKINEILEKYSVSFIAVAAARGEGRDLKSFLRDIVTPLEKVIPIETVNDAGARNWATSQAANQELPDVEPATRAVLSLARRVLDPLAEFVKIDPGLLVAGGPAMEIPPRMLRSALNDVIEECVAEVGPDLHFTNLETISRVPGLDSKLAKELDIKRASSRFKNIAQLPEVESINDRVYRNCAGFLRLHDSDNPLDVTQVHPERYELVAKMAQDVQCSVADLLGNKEKLEALKLEDYVDDKTCLETVTAIRDELQARGVDPRGTYEIFSNPEEIKDLTHLKVEMKVKGRITRVADFGIFVDIGVEPEGLVHESRIPREGNASTLNKFTVGQVIEVRVVHVDTNQKRLALSLLPEGALPSRPKPEGRGGRDGGQNREQGQGQRRPRPRGRDGGGREGGRDDRRGGPRRGGRDGGGRDRWGGGRSTERVYHAKQSGKQDPPEKTEKGEFTALSDLKSLLPEKKKPAPKKPKQQPTPPPPAEAEVTPVVTAPEETPAVTPEVETPTVETPVVETPVAETPAAEAPPTDTPAGDPPPAPEGDDPAPEAQPE